MLRGMCTHASRSASGVHFTLADGGAGGTILALAHGAPGSARDFRHLVAALTARSRGTLRCLTLDLPGHGATPEEEGDGAASQQAMARALWSAIDAATKPNHSASSVVLLGHSIGAHTVLEAVRQRPDGAKGVALLAPVNLRPHRALLNDGFFHVLRPSLRLIDQPIIGRGLLSFSEFFLKRVLGFPRGVSRREILHMNRRIALIDFERARESVASLQLPVFLAYARDDALIQSERSEEMMRLLDADGSRDGPRLVYPSGGHNIQKTHADELAKALIEWTVDLSAEWNEESPPMDPN